MQFLRLSNGWNADPNAPIPTVRYVASDLELGFRLNSFVFPDVRPDVVGVLAFTDVSRWRFDDTNDHAWFGGRGLYSRSAPAWGEFYEIVDADQSEGAALDWIAASGSGQRQFLFYFRDEAFQCIASNWSFSQVNQSEFALEDRF